MAGRVLGGILVGLVLLTVAGLALPRSYIVERGVVVDQPVPVLYELLNGFSRFPEWSPWAGRDPAAEFVPFGPGTGPGSGIEWRGRVRLVGEGRLEITDVAPFARVDMQLDLGDQGLGVMRFFLRDSQGGTEVRWQVLADLGPGRLFFDGILRRYMALPLARWVGLQMEQGLARLERLAGTPDSGLGRRYPVSVEEMAPKRILYVPLVVHGEAHGVGDATEDAFRELVGYLASQGTEPAGVPMVISMARGDGSQSLAAALPVTGDPLPLDGRIKEGSTPAGRVARWVHVGSPQGLPQSYRMLQAYLGARQLAPGAVTWEQYVTDPAVTPLDENITIINVSLDFAEP